MKNTKRLALVAAPLALAAAAVPITVGARAADDEADVTLTASRETFEGMLSGDVNPTMAFMTGKLKVDGAMGTAMKLGALLS